MTILNVCYLLVNAWTDSKKRVVDVRYTILYFIAAGAILLYKKEYFLWFGVVPGLLLLLLAVSCKKQIGIGDGIMVAAIGCVVGLRDILLVLQIGFLCAGIWGTILYRREKAHKNSIPFAPCLLLGYMIRLFI